MIAESTGDSDWDPAQLRRGRMTVYLVVLSEKLGVWAAVLRMWLGCIIRIITRGVPTEKSPVLFLVDEAAHLGKLRVLADAITLMRGMGIRAWLFFQSLNQLNTVYGPEAATLLDNLGTQQYFGTNSYQTAEALSNRIGDGTIVNFTGGSNSGSSVSQGIKSGSSSRNSGNNTSYAEGGRKLLFPSEILQLPKSTALVFHQNCPVLECQTVEYFADPAFRKRLLGGYGTGRSSDLGLGRVLFTLTLLAWACVLTRFVADLPPLYRPQPRPRPSIPGSFDVEYPFENSDPATWPDQTPRFAPGPWSTNPPLFVR